MCSLLKRTFFWLSEGLPASLYWYPLTTTYFSNNSGTFLTRSIFTLHSWSHLIEPHRSMIYWFFVIELEAHDRSFLVWWLYFQAKEDSHDGILNVKWSLAVHMKQGIQSELNAREKGRFHLELVCWLRFILVLSQL